jgi:hypothetical protein
MSNTTADADVWVCDWQPGSLNDARAIVSSLPLMLLSIAYLIAAATSLRRNNIFPPGGDIALHLFFLTLGLAILAVDTAAIFLATEDGGLAHFLLTGAGIVKTVFTTTLLLWVWYYRRNIDDASGSANNISWLSFLRCRLSRRNIEGAQALITVALVVALGAAHIPAFRSRRFLVNDERYKRSAWLLILHGILRFFGSISILTFAWISLNPNRVPKVRSLKDATSQAEGRGVPEGRGEATDRLPEGEGEEAAEDVSPASGRPQTPTTTTQPALSSIPSVYEESGRCDETDVDQLGKVETSTAKELDSAGSRHDVTITVARQAWGSKPRCATGTAGGGGGGDGHRAPAPRPPEGEEELVGKCGCSSLCCPICWLSVFCDDDHIKTQTFEQNPGKTSLGYRAMTRVLVVHSLAVFTRAILDIYDGSNALHRRANYVWSDDERFAVEIIVLNVPILALYLVAWRQAQPSHRFQTMSNHLVGLVSAVVFFVILALMRVLVKAKDFCSLDVPGPVAVGVILARAGASISFALIPPLYFSMLYGVFSLIESSRIGAITPRFHGSLTPIHGALGLSLAAAIAVHIAGHASLRELASELSPSQFAQLRNTSEVLADYIVGAKQLNDPYVAYPWVTGIIITVLLGLCVLSGLHEKSKVGAAFQRYHRWPAYYMLFGVAVHGLAAVLSPPLMYAVVLIFLGPALVTEHVLLRHFRRFASASDIVRLETFAASRGACAPTVTTATQNSHDLKETVYILRLTVPRETKLLGMDVSQIRLVGGWNSRIRRRSAWPAWITSIHLDTCLLEPLNRWWIAARKKTVRNIFFAPFTVKPGQWVWLRIANYLDKTLKREWHPFTVVGGGWRGGWDRRH